MLNPVFCARPLKLSRRSNAPLSVPRVPFRKLAPKTLQFCCIFFRIFIIPQVVMSSCAIGILWKKGEREVTACMKNDLRLSRDADHSKVIVLAVSLGCVRNCLGGGALAQEGLDA